MLSTFFKATLLVMGGVMKQSVALLTLNIFTVYVSFSEGLGRKYMEVKGGI